MLNHITMFQPSAIDNALSTMQILHKLITQINTIIDEINSIDSKANEYTDEQIKILKNFLVNKINTDIENTVRTLTEYINNQDEKNYNILNKKIDDVIKQVYIDIAKLKSDLTLYIDDNDNKIKVIINEVYEELYNLIKNGNDIIYSPVDGDLKSAKDVIFDIVNIVQQKNGINWNTLETLCNANYSLTDYTKINSDYDMYYKGGEYATVDYLNINGLYIVCQNAIRSITIDGGSSISFEGAGVLIPITTLQKFETLIVITDMNNNITHYTILNLDYALKPVTYNSWLNKLNTLLNFNNWYSFAFYTCFFLQESLTRTDGTSVDVKNQIQYMSLLNEDFYNAKGV